MGKKYHELIASTEWTEVRKLVLARDKNCVICGDTEHLQVHHRKYSCPMSKEFFNPDYLVTICQRCHDEVTNFQRRQRYNKRDLWPESTFMTTPLTNTTEKQEMKWHSINYMETPKHQNKKEKKITW